MQCGVTGVTEDDDPSVERGPAGISVDMIRENNLEGYQLIGITQYNTKAYLQFLSEVKLDGVVEVSQITRKFIMWCYGSNNPCTYERYEPFWRDCGTPEGLFQASEHYRGIV